MTESSSPIRPSSVPKPSSSPSPSPSSSSVRNSLQKSLEGIRAFCAARSCYEILPESFRLIVFDNKLSITRSLSALVTNGVVSAPLYDSTTQRFAGMFTLADVVHLIQYYYLMGNQYENVVEEVEQFQLGSLRKIEQAIDVPPPPTIFVHPEQSLADACMALVKTHARRLPLVDRDERTGKETIVSVLTQYRVLKFIAINCQHDCARLDQSIGSLGIGSYVSWYDHNNTSSTTSPPPPEDRFFPLATATLSTSVFDVVHIFSERGISAVPVVDEDGVVLNMYETVDIVDLVRQNAYQVLDKTISIALHQRSADFTGVMTCTPNDTLASILAYIRERRCHRFVIVEPEDKGDGRKKGALVGILSLSDVLRFLVGQENLKGLEVEGLGVHGLKGATATNASTTTDNKEVEEREDSELGSQIVLPSSRRSSEATDESLGALPPPPS